MSHHQAYQPLLPCASKYLQKKWDKTAQDLHKEKVKNMKPTKDLSSPPYTLGLLSNRQRTKKEHEERQLVKENERIYFCLEHCKPHYSARKWADEWAKTCEVRNRIARYPRGGAKQLKKQEKPRRMTSGRTENQHLSSDETSSSTSIKQTCEEEDSGTVLTAETA